MFVCMVLLQKPLGFGRMLIWSKIRLKQRPRRTGVVLDLIEAALLEILRSAQGLRPSNVNRFLNKVTPALQFYLALNHSKEDFRFVDLAL